MKKRIYLFISLLCLVSALSAQETAYYSPVLQVPCDPQASGAGGFAAPHWHKSEKYPLIRRAEEVRDLSRLPIEKGFFQLLTNGKDLLVKGVFTDSDIFNEATVARYLLDRRGDTVQLCLKPDSTPFYWLLQASPNDLQTCFLILGEGRRDLAQSRKPCKEILMTIKNRIDKKNNKWEIIMQIPLPLLTEKMEKETGKKINSWKFVIQRSNFSRHLRDTEISGFPQLVRHFYYTLSPSSAWLEFKGAVGK